MTHEDLDLRKALDTTGSGGSGSANLIPEVVSAGLRKFVEFASPIYMRTPKIDWPTNTYTFRSVTGRPTAEFTAEGNVASESNATYAKPTVSMKWITTKGRVTGPMLDVAKSPVDAWQTEIDLHADALVRKIERVLIAGDTASNPLEFDGFKKQITLNKDAANGQLTLSILDEALDIPAQYPTDIILSRAMGRRIWALLQAQQRFIDRTEIRAGLRVPVYNDLPILRVDTEADDDLTNVILMPDMRWAVMPILRQPTFELLGKTDDSESFYIRMYCTLAVEGAARYHVKIVNVTA